jgi:hypothetical protein
MEKTEIVKPITTTLTGQPNYNIWVQGMKSFLIGRKLWRIVTGDVVKPTREKDESATKFAERLEDWDNKNHQIITWLRNTSVPSIHIQFDNYDSAKELWEFLKNRYQQISFAESSMASSTWSRLSEQNSTSNISWVIRIHKV